MRYEFSFGKEVQQRAGGGYRLELPRRGVGGAKQSLAVEVGFFHAIEVHQRQVRTQRGSGGRSVDPDSPDPDQRGLQPARERPALKPQRAARRRRAAPQRTEMLAHGVRQQSGHQHGDGRVLAAFRLCGSAQTQPAAAFRGAGRQRYPLSRRKRAGRRERSRAGVSGYDGCGSAVYRPFQLRPILHLERIV